MRVTQIDQVLILVLEDQAHDRRLINNLRSLVQGTIKTKVEEQNTGQLRWKLRMYSLIGANYTTKWFLLVPGSTGLKLKEEGLDE
jgi:hypothetical protein